MIRLWEVEAAELLASGRPHLLALAPLAHSTEADLLATKREIVRIGEVDVQRKVASTFNALGQAALG
ncbi:MAG: hypothetical protein HY820_23580 [Acidobacteria bacterium]|nr:hypothetical protein [Acidobacteriota bacterium]